jgi:uncharacterized protein (DUF736 family)
MIFGNFEKKGKGYTGTIETFLFGSVPVTIEPVTRKKNDKMPDFRIVSEGKAIGAAWKQTSEKSGKEFLSVKLEHPGLDRGCALFYTAEGDGLVLTWNSPRPRQQRRKRY